jgi:sporulation protein YlmC with PRC-barrel domain
MTVRGPIDVALGLLDHQLLDSEERRCGKVDDVELEGLSEGNPQVAAILAGPPVWRGRGRLGKAAAMVARGRTVRIPWEEVREIGSAVHLRKSASELGLGRGDDRARPWIQRLPRSE